MKQWIVQGTTGSENLKLVDCPMPQALGNDVLVKFHAASLNYRDVMISNASSGASR
jgi:NADPH:quinone reductase-like Zn-dependent oxidoreductase